MNHIAVARAIADKTEDAPKLWYVFSFSHAHQDYICFGVFNTRVQAEPLVKALKARNHVSVAVAEYSWQEFTNMVTKAGKRSLFGNLTDPVSVPRVL